jgi:hypothetical protein
MVYWLTVRSVLSKPEGTVRTTASADLRAPAFFDISIEERTQKVPKDVVWGQNVGLPQTPLMSLARFGESKLSKAHLPASRKLFG